MDFGTVDKKLKAGDYTIVGDVVQDIYLTLDNCMLYNQDDSPFHKMAQRLKSHVARKTASMSCDLKDTLGVAARWVRA